MAKDEAVRITDTIQFIRTANVPAAHQNKRDTVADLLRDRNNAGAIANTVSPAMSQGSNFTIMGRAAVQETRHYRRALILIDMVLMNADRSVAPHTAAAVQDANLATALGDALNRVFTTQADVDAKLLLLKTNPLQFLSTCAFNMMGASTTGVVPYGLYLDTLNNRYNMYPVATVGNYVYAREDVFHLGVQGFASLQRTPKGGAGGQHIEIDGSVVHGADLMITTQLTGCSIPYHLNGGMLVAAHVQPPAGGQGEDACTSLRADGRLSNAPNMTNVFGPQNPKGVDLNNYLKSAGDNYCVGVRIGGSWDLYAQQRARGHNGNKVAWKIT